MDEVLNQMQILVEKNVEHYKSDFYEHDISFYNGLENNSRFIWIVRNSGTNSCGIYRDVKDETNRNATKETARLYYNHYGIQNGRWMKCKYFIVTKGKGIKRINLEQFRKLVE